MIVSFTEHALAVVLPDMQVQERFVLEAQAAQRAGRVQCAKHVILL
jgi:hypothetical protein